MPAFFRIVATLAGLAGLGVIVHEVLQKWQVIGPTVGVLWTIAALWILWACREATRSARFQARLRLAERPVRGIAAAVSIILTILAILALTSIPFLWFGIIRELARGGGALR
jgi:hypothetical protein